RVSASVTFMDAERFCRWCGKRLPTEEEWEYAAGGTDGRPFPWGKELPATQVCWAGPGSGFVLEPRKDRCEIGGYPADRSPFGITDMGGNRSEWTASQFCTYDTHHCTADRRVVRGGDQHSTKVTEMLVTHREAGDLEREGNGIRCAYTRR